MSLSLPTSARGGVEPKISRNFQIAKVLAILLVVVGHFGLGVSLWQLVTVGLFVFGFSSGYFTSAKYRDPNDRGMDTTKEWKFEVRFINKRGRQQTLTGVVTASGSGPKDDPLARYDVSAYAS